jgi:hypothetical protein
MPSATFSYWDDEEDDDYALIVIEDDNDYVLAVIEDSDTSIMDINDLANLLLYHAYEIYYWLTDVAPVLIKARLRQLGRDVIDSLPLLSWETKQEIKRWLIDHVGL